MIEHFISPGDTANAQPHDPLFLAYQDRQDYFYRELATSITDMTYVVINHLTSRDVAMVHEVARARHMNFKKRDLVVIHNFMNVKTLRELDLSWQVKRKGKQNTV